MLQVLHVKSCIKYKVLLTFAAVLELEQMSRQAATARAELLLRHLAPGAVPLQINCVSTQTVQSKDSVEAKC